MITILGFSSNFHLESLTKRLIVTLSGSEGSHFRLER